MKRQLLVPNNIVRPQVRLLLVLVVVALSYHNLLAASHKYRVTDPAVADQFITQGAKLKVDYGSFKLIEIEDGSGAGTLLRKSPVESADEGDVIELNAGHLNTKMPDVKALRGQAKAFVGKRMHLVQFVGPIKPEWHAALEADGLEIITYIPNNAYLVYGDHGAIQRFQARAQKDQFIQWEAEYGDDYKIHPRAKPFDAKGQPQRLPGGDMFAIQMVNDEAANAATLQAINGMKVGAIRQKYHILNYLNVIVSLPAGRLAEIAKHPEVVSIQPYYQRRKFCERQDQILAGNLSGNVPTGPGYLAWLTGKGFTQAQFTSSGFTVDVTDSGIDNGTTNAGHFGLYVGGTKASGTRVIYSRLEGSANPGTTIQGCDGHGNLNAHIICGHDNLSGFPFADSSGYHYGLGVCPFVRVGASVIFDPDTFTDPNYPNLAARAYRDGARISNNSWGADTAGAYDADSQAYDSLVRDAQPAGSAVVTAGNQEMIFVFAAGNAGPGTQTVGSPGTAKNVLTVGAGENVQAFGGSDWSGVADVDANSANDVVDFSSRGPCSDSRIKPDICAPGTHVSGGVAQVASPSATGTAISCFDGLGVSGGNTNAVDSNFFPSGQEFYSASSGTSHSTPAVAGCCALLRQFFINNAMTPPSPAMTKAFLMNSARYMTGLYANDTLPSNRQGMGGANLGTAFDGVARILRDQLSGDKFTTTGQTQTYTGNVVDSTKPFRVTLAWTDAPGSTTGNAYKNNLDLTVTIGGNTYKGNVFSGANSATGGISDVRNNVESVFLPAGVTGPFSVTVTAANINSDGVPNEAPTVDQDFALVIYNGSSAATVPLVITSPQSQTITVGTTVNLTVSASGTSPLAYQWRKNNSTIAGATNTVYTLTNVQLSAAGNFDVVVTNSVGTVTSSVAVVSVVMPSTNAAVFAQWNFNSTVSDTNVGTGLLSASTGGGTSTAIGGVTQSFFAGGGIDTNVNDNSSLGLANFPATTVSNKTAGAQFVVSTAGKQNIIIRWDMRVSSTGSRYFRLQYTTNGTTFLDYPTAVTVGNATVFESFTNNLSTLAGVNNNTNFAFRLVAEWQSTAVGSGTAGYIAASTNLYAPSGTVRYEMVTVIGDIMPLPNATPSLGTINYSTNHIVQFGVGGVAGYKYAIQVSTNLIAWSPVVTNTAPFTYTQTNAPSGQRFYRAVYLP